MKFELVFFSLIFVRALSAFLSPIADCDEVFNYWEPLHYLLYGKGFQTWEYSPIFALRSYLYILFYWVFAKYFSISGADKLLVFIGTRIYIGIFSAICETAFIYGISKKFGNGVAYLTNFFLFFSTGMFFSSNSFLPSSFSMSILMLTYGVWLLDEEDMKAITKFYTLIISSGISIIIGWPFCIVFLLPIIFDTIYKYGTIPTIKTTSYVTIAILAITSYVDYFFYKKVFFTPINLVMYNKGSGSERYGVEPFNFYFKNLTLNFNIAFWITLFLPIYLILKKNYKNLLYILPFHIWFFFFSVIKHKEERFMYVAYPIICLASAYVVSLLWENRKKLFGVLICLTFVLLSLSRTTSLFINYHAPLGTYSAFYMYASHHNITEGNVCVGKEWYRFPSSFFLPHNTSLRFLKSDFNGLLPKYFEPLPNGTWIIPTEMNDDNREEMSRYWKEENCDYIIDLDLTEQNEKRYLLDDKNYELELSLDFLDSKQSKSLTRAFYIPWKNHENVYRKYYLLKRKKNESK